MNDAIELLEAEQQPLLSIAPEDMAIRKAIERRQKFIERFGEKAMGGRHSGSGRVLWQAIKEKGIVDEIMGMMDEGIEPMVVMQYMKEDFGITTTEPGLRTMFATKKKDWLFHLAMSEAIDRKLQTVDGTQSLDQITRAAAEEHIMTLSVIGDMGPKELIALRTLHVNEDALAIRKLEAQRRLYEWQWRAANFIADFLKDEARTRELQALAANKDIPAQEFIEQVRARVYGSETINKPPGYENIGARQG